MAYMDGSAGSVGRIMAALLGVPARHHADVGRLGIAFQLANFIRDVGEDTRLDRVYLPAEDRDALRRLRGGPAARRAPRPRCARCSRTRSSAPAACSPPARPAIAAAPASVRPGIRFATGLYGRMLDRVEATGFDVLGRRTGVRVWHIPGAALEALRGALRADDAARRHPARRAERTRALRGRPDARADVLICGASFAGLAGRARARRLAARTC